MATYWEKRENAGAYFPSALPHRMESMKGPGSSNIVRGLARPPQPGP